MKTIETEIIVTQDGMIEHSLADFPVHDVGPWPDDLSLRREDLYGDDER